MNQILARWLTAFNFQTIYIISIFYKYDTSFQILIFVFIYWNNLVSTCKSIC